MAITAQLFDGTTLEFPDDTPKSVIDKTVERATEERQVKSDTGFTGALSAGTERLKGDIAALAGRVGITNTDEAEAYKAHKERLAEKKFKPTEEGWSEAPWMKFKETLGGSLPYTAAPLAAGAAALALPATVAAAPVLGGLTTLGTAIGVGGAGLASLGQFTGSNISRQMQENPNMKLGETNLGAAAAAAIPQAALDVVSMAMIPGIGKIFGAAGKEITPEIARRIAEQGILKTAGYYGTEGVKLAGKEGATEAGQQVLERLQAGLNITDEQARSEYFDSFLGGAVLGGALSVPGVAIERRQIVNKGAQMEKDEQQKAIQERQKAQQEAALAEQEQIGKTKEALGVSKMLALPAPATLHEAPVGIDPLINPLGNFRSTDLSPKEVAEVNRRRVEAGLPRIGRTFSIEDLSNVFTPEEAQDQTGVLNRLIASRTGYQAGQDFSPKTVEFAAQKRGITTGTQGFKDFLKRTTGLDDLEAMSPPQRLAVAQALQKIPEGEVQSLQSGISNAKTFTEDQYNDVVNGLTKEFKEMGNVANGRSSVLKHIEKYSGLLNPADQKRMLDRLVKDDVLDHDMETREVNGNKKVVELFKPAKELPGLPGGMDVRAETFKQGEAPAAYEIKAGSQLIDTVDSEEEANKNLESHIKNRQAKVAALGKQIATLESHIAGRDAELTKMKSLGESNTDDFFHKEANFFGQDSHDREQIKALREQQQTFAAPVRMSPVGTKPITSEGFTYYENGKAIARFDTQEKADKFGISRLDDKTLQKIIDAAPHQKQTGTVKRYSDLAEKELNERQSIEPERGITVTTTKGLKGAKERLESLGIYSKEAVDNLEKLRQTLLPALKRFGLENVALRIVNSIEDGKADGMYIQQIMTIALDAKDPMGTLRHESIHALKELGAFTPQEWKVLENKAKSEWVQKYIKDVKLYDAYKEQYQAENGNLIGFEPYIQEEAIAEAFKHFKVGNLQPGMIGNIWMRLNKMFEALRNAFNKLGFQTTEDIFTKVEEGEKKPTVKAAGEEPKYALRDTKKEQAFIDNIYDETPVSPFNPDQHAFVYDNAESGVFFELKPSTSAPNAVEVYWFNAFPLRSGVGTKGMKQLQDMAAEEGLSLTLMPWDKGQVSKAALTKFYKSVGFKPLRKGSTTLIWNPEKAAPKLSLRAPETKEFKEFFRGSKVVDTDGKPLLMYHSTTSEEDFDIFDTNRDSYGGAGSFFSSEPYNSFIEGQEGGKIIPAYLSLKNPAYETLPAGDKFNKNKLMEQGYDGVVFTSPVDDHIVSAVAFKPEQIKSVFNEKPSATSPKFALREFKMDDLPESGNYTLKAGTEIFHGAHKARAEEIEKSGKTLLLPSKVKEKSGGGNLYEGNLIWFGDKDLATGHSKSEVDTSKARYDAENGIFREAGKAFSTITDKDYKLLNIWNYKLSQAEADQLNDVLGLPDYKRVGEGDSPYSAAYRAHTNGKNVNRYQVERAGEFSDGLAMTAKALGFDGLFDTSGIAFTAENGIRLGEEGAPMQRFSLRSQVDPAIQGRVNATTTVRKEAGFVERIVDAMSPTAMTRLRQAFINKYDSIEKLSHLRGEKMGTDQLLAENSAIAAVLQSDRAAGIAASSFRDGVPVLDKGYTYVSNMDDKVKGLIPVLEPLMKYKDPYVFQLFQYYAGTRRGRRLDAEGREKNFTKEDIEAGKKLEQQFPEFATVFDEYQKYNQGLVKYMMDTGVISAQEAKTWTENWDYIPFYRQLDGKKTAGPKVFSPIAGVAKPKKLKGSEAELDDFMETIVRNARAAIEAGMKNEAARRVIRDVTDFGLGERLPSSQSGSDVVSVKENGITVYYRVADPLLVESLKGLNLPQLPFMDFLSAPANLLRNFVTKDPGFILANLGRDSMQAWITSGTDMKPLVDSFKQFGRELLNQSPEAYALARSGLTGYDFAGDVASTAKQVEKELRKRSGTRTAREQALLPVTAFWDMLEKGSHASDMATRAEVYKRTLERTGSEAEAFYQAMEVMNFSRKGNSALIRILSAMIPFFNARVQGLDVLYRTGFGKAAMENKEKIQKAFIFRSMVLLGTSVMYWAMVSDDDEYKKLSKEERDNYWIIPALEINGKPFRFPIPFELGVLFKVLPERALEYSFGTDTGKDVRESLLRNTMSTLSFNPIPQAVLPAVENITNHSFFTGEPIVGKGKEGLAPQYQYNSSTSDLAIKLGKELDYSPAKIENFIRGYTGTMGSYAMMMIDSALSVEGDSVRATKRMEQLPVIKRFFAGDSGTISAYYDLKDEVDTVVRTVNDLQRSGKAEDLKEYLEENKKLYNLKGYVGVLDKSMKKLSEANRMIAESKTMTADEKREAIDRIHDAQLKLTERVRVLRKNYE